MSTTFNINEYIDNLKNINDIAKARFFINYLKSDMGKDILELPDIFGLLDKNYLLSSLETYIKTNRPAKIVAESYRRTMISLCTDICKDYNIKNTFLESVTETEEFIAISKQWIENLKEPKIRECLSLADFEVLNETIGDFFNTKNLEEKINNSIQIKYFKPNYYGRLASAVALKLIQNYGLDNQTIVDLKASNLNMEKRTLTVDTFELHINNELALNFELLLKYRELVVKKNNISIDTLFIKKDATPYLDKYGHPDSGQLFLLMDEALKTTSTTKLRHRRIIELVSKGANINLLSQLTNVSTEKIVEICVDDKSNLENLFNGTNNLHKQEHQTLQKGLLRCPFCGNYKGAHSENWILVQINGEEKKHIACRECRGLDGKYRY